MAADATESASIETAEGVSPAEQSLRDAARAAAQASIADGSADDAGVEGTAEAHSLGEEGATPSPATEDKNEAAPAEKKPDEPKKLSRKERREQYKARQSERQLESTQRQLKEALTEIHALRGELQGLAPLKQLHTKYSELDESMARDAAGTLRQRYGLTPQELVSDKTLAQQADAQGRDPMLRELESLKKMIAERDERDAKEKREAQEQMLQRKQREDIEADIKVLSADAQNGEAEAYPFWYQLHPRLRTKLARMEVMRRIIARKNGEDVEYTEDALLDALDDEAREYVGQSDQVAGEAPRARQDRAKSSARSSARATSAPAERREQSEGDLRDAALRAARQTLGR